jgi:mannosyltransferase OCH1-like enzyme
MHKMPFFIEKINKKAPSHISGVPLIIYRSWITNEITNEMKKTIDKTIQMTPEFDNYFYSDVDCDNFIKDNFEPNVLNAFRSLKPGAFKSDLWRYCILYKKGGVYIDIKLELHIPLINIIKDYPVIMLKDNPKFMEKRPIWNGIMSSPPNNKIFIDCIESIVLSCKNKDYKRDLLDITGPSLLGQIFTKHHGNDNYDGLPFIFETQEVPITYKNVPMASQYKEYRKDQNKFQKTPHYSEMYNKRDIFDQSIIFL